MLLRTYSLRLCHLPPIITKPQPFFACGFANYIWYSPVEVKSFEGLPPAYIETAEFDCLHDDGILYAELLRKSGIAVTLNETKGTMHGFDIATKAPTTLL